MASNDQVVPEMRHYGDHRPYQAHQLVNRVSVDVDLFTDSWDPEQVRSSCRCRSESSRRDGLGVDIARRAETFARVEVTDPLRVNAARSTSPRTTGPINP